MEDLLHVLLGLVMGCWKRRHRGVKWVGIGVCVLLMQGRLRLYLFVCDEALAPY